MEMPAENDVNTECIFYYDFLPTGSKKPRIRAWNEMYELTWHVLVLSKGGEGGNRLVTFVNRIWTKVKLMVLKSYTSYDIECI